MEKHEALNEVLNDLVKINNDRIAGYDKAISESKDLDIDLKALYVQMKEQSAGFKVELIAQIEKANGIVEDDTTSSGKIYRAWMDIKATFTDSDKNSILAACEFGEDAAQRAYESALASDAMLNADVRQFVAEEQQALKVSHDLIKKKRDTYKSLQK
jgi:uncharacterized protein (TIGR02284 family)